jgi:GDP-mannose 6-dehydrogenase
LFRKVTAGLPDGGRVLLAGLAFKADTDDLRESPNVDLARMLLQAGYDLAIFDPAVEASQLVGANLGYVYARIPRLEALLVDKAVAESGEFDRVIATNATAKLLSIPAEKVIDISRLD